MAASPLYSAAHAARAQLRQRPTCRRSSRTSSSTSARRTSSWTSATRSTTPFHGEFWLDHCGALMDVEPMGEEFVHGMCHDIEDPTFDATAGATHRTRKCARSTGRRAFRPTARRIAIGGVTIDPDDGLPVGPHPSRGDRRQSEIARIAIDDPGADAEPGGWYDYSGDVRSRLHARRPLAPRSWSRCRRSRCRRTCSRTRTSTASRDAGVRTKHAANAPQVFTGTAGVAAAGCRRCSASPATTPKRSPSSCSSIRCSNRARTWRPVIELIDERTVRFALLDTPCFHERDGLSWFASMSDRAASRARRNRAGGQPARRRHI